MGNPGLQDLGARIIAIAQSLASGQDPGTDQLKSLLPAQVTNPLQDTQNAIEAAANGLKERAQDQLAAVETAKAAAERAAEDQLQQSTSQLQQQLDQATAKADRAVTAAMAGLEQAKATGEQALQAATDSRDEAVAQAESAKANAQGAYDQAIAQAQQVADAATQAAEKLVNDAQQSLQDAEAQVASAAQQAQQAIDGAVAAAAQLPDQAVALGTDTLDRIEGALKWPSGILSLLAKALIWLKKECFPDVEELQVIWHEPADGPTGLGLQWLKNDAMLRLVYRPAVPPAVGAGTLLIETKGSDTVSFEAGEQIAVLFKGKADQHVVVGKGVSGPEAGMGDVSLAITFGALAFSKAFGPLTARLDKPTITAALSHGGTWTYDVTLTLPTYGATLRLSDLLRQAGLALPITVPSIDEMRSLSLEVANGSFSMHEGASA